jgi:hypothetical protein
MMTQIAKMITPVWRPTAQNLMKREKTVKAVSLAAGWPVRAMQVRARMTTWTLMAAKMVVKTMLMRYALWQDPLSGGLNHPRHLLDSD